MEDGKTVENEFSQIGQVVYRGGNDFEIWMDTCDHFYDTVDEMWSGHTWKPYFYYYHYSSKGIEAYGGEAISGEKFEELSGTNLIEEIKAEGYTVETIIWWENDIAISCGSGIIDIVAFCSGRITVRKGSKDEKKERNTDGGT